MMTKSVGMGSGLHGSITANWDSPGMAIFDRLDPGQKAQLMSRATRAEARPTLERLAAPEDASLDVMTLLILALDKHGLDATKDALA